MKKEIFQYIEFQDLPESFRTVAEIVGIDVARMLIQELGGIAIFIPSFKSLSATQLKYVADNAERNKIALARDLDMSSRHVEKLLKQVNQKDIVE